LSTSISKRDKKRRDGVDVHATSERVTEIERASESAREQDLEDPSSPSNMRPLLPNARVRVPVALDLELCLRQQYRSAPRMPRPSKTRMMGRTTDPELEPPGPPGPFELEPSAKKHDHRRAARTGCALYKKISARLMQNDPVLHEEALDDDMHDHIILHDNKSYSLRETAS